MQNPSYKWMITRGTPMTQVSPPYINSGKNTPILSDVNGSHIMKNHPPTNSRCPSSSLFSHLRHAPSRGQGQQNPLESAWNFAGAVRHFAQSGRNEYVGISSGWWCHNHLEKWLSSSMGRMTSHILWKIKNVWNHQPVFEYWGAMTILGDD